MRKFIIVMGCAEFSVIRAIKELNELHDGVYSQQEIAEYISCGIATVWRAFATLKRAGILEVEGSPRKGFKYIIHDKRERVLQRTQ